MSPRRLLVAEHHVTEADRSAWLSAAANRRARTEAATAHLWVFEHDDTRGRFLEFTESTDATLLNAMAGGDPSANAADSTDAAGITRWHEVELG